MKASQAHMHLLTGVYSAALVDLMMKGRIKIEKGPFWESEKEEGELYSISILDATPTGSYLDKAVFNQLLNYSELSAQPQRLDDVLSTAVDGKGCVTSVLKSLIDCEIFGEKSTGSFGIFKRYPVLKADVVEGLADEIGKIAFEKQFPDSFMLALLTITTSTDNMLQNSFVRQILKKDNITDLEFNFALENVKNVVQNSGKRF